MCDWDLNTLLMTSTLGSTDTAQEERIGHAYGAPETFLVSGGAGEGERRVGEGERKRHTPYLVVDGCGG